SLVGPFLDLLPEVGDFCSQIGELRRELVFGRCDRLRRGWSRRRLGRRNGYAAGRRGRLRQDLSAATLAPGNDVAMIDETNRTVSRLDLHPRALGVEDAHLIPAI